MTTEIKAKLREAFLKEMTAPESYRNIAVLDLADRLVEAVERVEKDVDN